MIDPNFQLFKTFYDVLYDGIEYNGSKVPVYSMPPNKDEGIYIQIMNPNISDGVYKDKFSFTGNIDIQIFGFYEGNNATPIDVETVSYLVLNRIKPTVKSVLQMTDFKMVYLDFDNSVVDNALNTDTRSYRKIITLRFALDDISDRDPWILATGLWDDDGEWSDTDLWRDSI